MLTARRLAESIRGCEGPLEPLFGELLRNDGNRVLSFLNAHAVNLACAEPAFRQALLDSDMLLRDGIGVKILMKACGLPPGANMNGTDLIPRLLRAHLDQPIALYGSSTEVAISAAAALEKAGASRVTHCDGFQPPAHYLDLIRTERPRIVVLAMGMPRQELLAQRIRSQCPGPILVINGGAILDFMAQRHPRAPLWLQRLGLEWLFRLCREPRRLWRRYILGNTAFLARTAIVATCRLPQRPPPRP